MTERKQGIFAPNKTNVSNNNKLKHISPRITSRVAAILLLTLYMSWEKPRTGNYNPNEITIIQLKIRRLKFSDVGYQKRHYYWTMPRGSLCNPQEECFCILHL